MAKRAAGVAEDVHRLGGAQDEEGLGAESDHLDLVRGAVAALGEDRALLGGVADSARSTGTTIA